MRLRLSLPIISTIAAVLLAATPRVYAAAAAVIPQPDIKTVDDWDRVTEEMRNGIASTRYWPRPLPTDSRNRTPAQDYSDNVMTPEVTQQLETLREQARAQASKPKAVEKILAQVRTIYGTETYKINLITAYWRAAGAVTTHERILMPLLETASAADSEPIRTNFLETETNLVKSLNTGLTRTSEKDRTDTLNQIQVTQDQALKYYNERRATLAQQQMLNPGVPVKTRNRVGPCPEPSTVNSGKASPSLADDNVAPESVYPPDAKALQVEGAVVLRVRVSETGCMQSAEIVRTSGYVPLDESALVYAENARYKPAVKDGKPVPGEFMFKIGFQLAD